MKKIIALLLIVLTLVSVAACGSGAGQDSETTTAPQSEDISTAAPGRFPEGGPNYLPETEYNGYAYNVLLAGSGIASKFNDFAGESNSGYALVSEAIFRRNSEVEKLYGITIGYTEKFGNDSGNGQGYTAVVEDYLAGESQYSVCEVSTYAAAQLAIGGFLYDLNSLPYLDCSQDWWDGDAYSDLTINGRLFFTTGEISSIDNMATHCILFSKDFAKDKGITDIYERVENGSWTLDAFIGYALKVSEDIDGNDTMDENDRYGVLTWNDALQATLIGSRVRIATVNQNGEMELSLYSDKSTDVINKFATVFFDRALCYNYTSTLPSSEWDKVRVKMFEDKRALFSCTVLNTVPKHRDSLTEFGILPYPKYDEAQTEYGSYVGASYSVMITVEKYIDTPDLEKIGVLTDALAYESLMIVTPAYYEQTLIGRDVRDEESRECLDIIFGNRCFDVGIYYKVGGYTGSLTSMMASRINRFTNIYEAGKRAAEKTAEDLNVQFAEWKSE